MSIDSSSPSPGQSSSLKHGYLNNRLCAGAALMRNLFHNFRFAWKFPRWRWALIVALLSDALGFGLALVPFAEWVLDAVTVVVLFAVLGFRWPLLSALVVEAVPVLQAFPAWILVVAALASTETRKPAPGTGAVVPVAPSIQKTGTNNNPGE